MSCKRTDEIIDAVLLGEMNGSLAKHMAACGECRATAAAAKPAAVVLQAAGTEKAPDGLWARVEAQLPKQDETRGLPVVSQSNPSPLPMSVPIRRRWFVPSSVAALVAVLISVWALWPVPPSPRNTDLPTVSVVEPADLDVPDAEFYLSEHWSVEEEYSFSGASLSGNMGSGG